jgi:SEC-C motif
MLTRRRDLPRDATAAFLRDCFSQLEPQRDCYVWSGWLDAVAWLGLTELKPLAQQVFRRGSIDPGWLTFKDFEQDLQYAVARPEAEPLHADGDPTLFGETVAELSGWNGFKPKAPRNEMLNWVDSLGTPHRDPLRKVGRNDPCPCGSGKKFKKCCLNAASEDAFAAPAVGSRPGDRS